MGIAVADVAYGGLADVTLEARAGERVAILGPNGAGKSTLLRVIAGLVRPDRGTARAEGPIGWVPQDFRASLLPWLDAEANVALTLRPLRLDRRARARRLAEALAVVPIAAPLLGRRPRELSGGEQQRVALARALAGAPRTLLLDEPFSAIDAAARADLRGRLAAAVAARGTTLVLVTHELDDVFDLADRAVVLGDGRIVSELEVAPDRRAWLERACAEAS